MTGRKLRFGMVGGGRGAFIGAVHRIAAQMDGQAELVAGAFSSDPQRSRDSAADLFVAAERAYGSYREMATRRGGAAARATGWTSSSSSPPTTSISRPRRCSWSTASTWSATSRSR